MSDELVFMMGKFAATFPTDRLYAKNHMWAQPAGDGFRFGLSAYAVRLLQDVYFLEWSIDAPQRLREKQTLGNIESSKAESELYAPATGVLTEFNPVLLKDPTPINVGTYDSRAGCLPWSAMPQACSRPRRTKTTWPRPGKLRKRRSKGR